MAASIACPKCGGPIHCTTKSFPGGLSITLDRASVAWHGANCFGGPPPGDREPFCSIIPSARGFGAALRRAA